MNNKKFAHNISIKQALFWTFLYFVTIILFTIVDMVLWRKFDYSYSGWLSLGTTILFTLIFFGSLMNNTNYKINIFNKFAPKKILYGIICSLFLYFLLDKFFDPILEGLFPRSEEIYLDSILDLAKTPILSFIHICILSPIVEELLMRDFILGGLKTDYGDFIALIASSLIFGILHINIVQAFSAFIAGLVLGKLYLETNSIFSCIIAHCGYNTISLFIAFYSLI